MGVPGIFFGEFFAMGRPLAAVRHESPRLIQRQPGRFEPNKAIFSAQVVAGSAQLHSQRFFNHLRRPTETSS